MDGYGMNAGAPNLLAAPLARIFARLIDTLLLGVSSWIVKTAVFIMLLMANFASGLFLWGLGIPDVLTPALSGLIWGSLVALLSLCGVVYHVLLESGVWQATVGKRWLEIQVTDTFGDRIPPMRALVRTVVLALSSLLFGIPLLISVVMLFIHPKRQTLHDLLAGTLVTRGVFRSSLSNEA